MPGRYNIVKQVGNYAESYERNIRRSASQRGINKLWKDGGLHIRAADPLTRTVAAPVPAPPGQGGAIRPSPDPTINTTEQRTATSPQSRAPLNRARGATDMSDTRSHCAESDLRRHPARVAFRPQVRRHSRGSLGPRQSVQFVGELGGHADLHLFHREDSDRGAVLGRLQRRVGSAGKPDTRPVARSIGIGACWALINEKFRFIMFGTYPYAEHWRPALVIRGVPWRFTASVRCGVSGIAIWSGSGSSG